MLFKFDKENIIYGLILMHWINFLIRLILQTRQLFKCSKATEVPEEVQSVVTAEQYRKNRVRCIVQLQFTILKDLIDATIISLILYYRVPIRVWRKVKETFPHDADVITGWIWRNLIDFGLLCADAAFSLCKSFYFKDDDDLLQECLYANIYKFLKPLPSLCIKFISFKYGGYYAFQIIWLLSAVIDLINLELYCNFVEPSCYKCERLKGKRLRQGIKTAMDIMFDQVISDVLVCENRKIFHNMLGSKIFNRQIIWISRDLFTYVSVREEILAVVLQEYGHRLLGHLWKKFVIFHFTQAIRYFIITQLFNAEEYYKAFGFEFSYSFIVGVTISEYAMVLFNTFQAFLLNHVNRKMEFNSDMFSAKMGKAAHLKAVMEAVPLEKNEFPVDDPYYANCFKPFPSRLDRIKKLSYWGRIRAMSYRRMAIDVGQSIEYGRTKKFLAKSRRGTVPSVESNTSI